MKTIESVLAEYKSQTLDGRDLSRLAEFLTIEQLPEIGYTIKTEAADKWKPKEWTKDNILVQLKNDVAFGFEKALNKRGISAGLMFSVVHMWNWILEEGLENHDEDAGYAQYGLPLFKATAVKYGFDNPIGDDTGTESQYESD